MQSDAILHKAEQVAAEVLAPQAALVDRDAAWPEEGLRRLLAAGLGGLVVPRRFGGLGEGLLGLAQTCERLGRACSSTAMCFGMHAVGSAVLAAKATPAQEALFLRPIVEGRHITTLALSESGTGSHFYLPATKLEREREGFRLNGEKSFVTSGGYADSYVLSVLSGTDDSEAGVFSAVVVPADAPGLEWQGPWDGLGMRGNASRTVKLRDVRIPPENLLGGEGDEMWYLFEVMTPYFLMAMTGTYLGIADRAIEIAVAHLKRRRHTHSHEPLAKQQILQHRLGELWAVQERTRCLTHYAAAEIDGGNREALPALLSAKAEVAEACVTVINEAMTLTGGRAYGADSELGRLLRDARAAHVMAPTTELLRLWVGRHLLGEPLLSGEAG